MLIIKSVRKKRQLTGQRGLIGNCLRNIRQRTSTLSNFPVKNTIRESFSLSAKCDPCFQEDQKIWMIPKHPIHSQSLTTDENGLPVPPEGMLWGGEYERQISVYLEAGKRDTETMRNIIQASGFQFKSGDRNLDFGCSGGRMIRWLQDLANKCEIWGTDVNQASIIWCQQHISPPFKFFNATSFPYLPFSDNYFNCIYSGSVFTHIPMLADAWLLELRRILQPNGRLYITVHDKRTMEISQEKLKRGEKAKFDEQICQYVNADFGMLVLSSGNYQRGFDAQVFYDIDFICQKWGLMLKILSVTAEAYADQTAILLTKES